jgi:hypothetical protein
MEQNHAESTLAYFSAWASIISLLITLINTYLIIRIRAGIVVNLTLEPSLQRLRENSMEMNRHLGYYEIHANGFFETAGVCEANVRAIRRRLGYLKGRFTGDLLRSLRRYRKDRSRQNAQEVYGGLQHVCQHIANLVEERRIIG